jgi:hypothetical protein
MNGKTIIIKKIIEKIDARIGKSKSSLSCKRTLALVLVISQLLPKDSNIKPQLYKIKTNIKT